MGADPYQCINCAHELEDAFGGPDNDSAMCMACDSGSNFINIDVHGAYAQGKGRFLAG